MAVVSTNSEEISGKVSLNVTFIYYFFPHTVFFKFIYLFIYFFFVKTMPLHITVQGLDTQSQSYIILIYKPPYLYILSFYTKDELERDSLIS